MGAVTHDILDVDAEEVVEAITDALVTEAALHYVKEELDAHNLLEARTGGEDTR